MFRSLLVRNYRIWFASTLIANIGGWMQSTAISWVVLTELTDNDAMAVGVNMALQFGPQLFLVPIVGYLVDRFDRKILVFCTQVALMLLAAWLGTVMLLGAQELWHFYLFSLIFGTISSLDAPARQTFVSDMVSREMMSNAVALNSASFNAARMIGPAAAGIAIVLVDTGWIFVVNAIAYGFVLMAIALIRQSELPGYQKIKPKNANIMAGFRYIASRTDLVVVFIAAFLIGSMSLNMPIFASTMAVEFGRGAGEYGLISSAMAIGAFAAALTAAKRDRARFRTIILGAGGLGISQLLAAASQTFELFVLANVLGGFTVISFLVTANGFVQTTTASQFRGRVMTVYMAILLGGTPIGAPFIGWIANELGPRWAIVAGATAALIACGIGVTWLFVAQQLRIRLHPTQHWRLVLTRDASPETTMALGERFNDTIAFTAPIRIPQLAVEHEEAHAEAGEQATADDAPSDKTPEQPEEGAQPSPAESESEEQQGDEEQP